jgi:hypothetical protein
LVFAGGQRYPVIIGDESFALNIAGPGEPPSFAGSGENDFLYKKLSGNDEQWRKENLPKKIKLSLFIRIGDDLD